VKVQIIFTGTEGDQGQRSMISRHFLALYEKNDLHLMENALSEWYSAGKKDYEAFAAKYPMNGELQLQENKLSDMSRWCKKTEITFTPTIFINGHQLPEIYTIEDLKYFLPA
jgi:hypothetical protein